MEGKEGARASVRALCCLPPLAAAAASVAQRSLRHHPLFALFYYTHSLFSPLICFLVGPSLLMRPPFRYADVA